MKIADLKNIQYWAEEYKIPLFFISSSVDDFADNVLFLYSNKTARVYTLDKRHSSDEQLGYKFFMRKNGFEKYFAQVEKAKKNTLSFVDQVKLKNLAQLSDEKLQELFWQSLEVLFEFSQVYLKTEANKMTGFANETDKKILRKLNKTAEIRLELKTVIEQLYFVIFGLILKQIAKRVKLTVDDMFFYTMEELTELMQKKKKIVVQKRKKGYILFKFKGKKEIIVGSKFKKYKQYIANKEKSNFQNKELVGVTVSRGNAKGKVVLLLHNKRNLNKEVKAFKKGSVLVTEMTRPNSILACKKAVAIITDEGGITCHAAIVSRELGIPCIVGTKIATKVLKNGDLVEVDANKGVVKILK